MVDKLYITHVDGEFEGDTFFPEVDYNNWKSTLVMSNEADKKNPLDFSVIVYEKG